MATQRLFLDPSDYTLLFAQLDTAGIHEQKRCMIPLYLGEIAVTGDTRGIVY